MRKIDQFFRAMAWMCLGIVIGFLLAPIKKGVRISIGSNNCDSQLMNQFEGGQEFIDSDFDEDELEDIVMEDIEDEEDGEEDVPF